MYPAPYLVLYVCSLDKSHTAVVATVALPKHTNAATVLGAFLRKKNLGRPSKSESVLTGWTNGCRTCSRWLTDSEQNLICRLISTQSAIKVQKQDRRNQSPLTISRREGERVAEDARDKSFEKVRTRLMFLDRMISQSRTVAHHPKTT